MPRHAKQHDLDDAANHGVGGLTPGATLVAGTPVTSGPLATDVADAVTKKHTQGTDQGLDTGGPNATTAAQVKTAVDRAALMHAIRTTVANDLALTDGTVLVNAAGTYDLPVPTSGARLRIKRISGGAGAGNYVILSTVANGGQIDGATVYNLTSQYDSAEVISNGTNWYVI